MGEGWSRDGTGLSSMSGLVCTFIISFYVSVKPPVFKGVVKDVKTPKNVKS